METADSSSDPPSSSSDSEIVQVMENRKRKLVRTAQAFKNFMIESEELPKGVFAYLP